MLTEKGVLSFIALLLHLSVVIALVNIVPIPGLDGWHAMIFLAEAFLARDLPLKIKKRLLKVGLASLIFLGAFMASKDLLLFLV